MRVGLAQLRRDPGFTAVSQSSMQVQLHHVSVWSCAVAPPLDLQQVTTLSTDARVPQMRSLRLPRVPERVCEATCFWLRGVPKLFVGVLGLHAEGAGVGLSGVNYRHSTTHAVEKTTGQHAQAKTKAKIQTLSMSQGCEITQHGPLVLA